MSNNLTENDVVIFSDYEDSRVLDVIVQQSIRREAFRLGITEVYAELDYSGEICEVKLYNQLGIKFPPVGYRGEIIQS